jgi:hypothetical protein
MTRNPLLAALLLLGLSSDAAIAGGEEAGEQAIPAASLPQAVRDAVATRFPGADITAASQEGTGKKLEYEATVTVGGHRYDLAFDATGRLLEQEERVAPEALPEPVRATLAGRFAGWTVRTAESATTDAGVTYEILLVQGEKRREVKLAADGKVLRTENLRDEEDEEDEDEDDD